MIKVRTTDYAVLDAVRRIARQRIATVDRIEIALHATWPLTRQQIYRALENLEAAGYLESSLVCYEPTYGHSCAWSVTLAGAAV